MFLLWRDLVGTPPHTCVRISRSLSPAVILLKESHRAKAASEDLTPFFT